MSTHPSDCGSYVSKGSAVPNPVFSFTGLVAENSSHAPEHEMLAKINLHSGRAGDASLTDSTPPAEASSSAWREAAIIVMMRPKPKSY